MTKIEYKKWLKNIYKLIESETGKVIMKRINTGTVINHVEVRTAYDNYMIELFDYELGEAIAYIVIQDTFEYYYNSFYKQNLKRYYPKKHWIYYPPKKEKALEHLHSLGFGHLA